MRTKRCARCQTVKPWSDYTPRTRWEDGTVRNVQANCKACNAELCREWRRRKGELPEVRRRRQNAWQASLDPERKAIIRDRQKVWWRRRVGTTPDQYRHRERLPHPSRWDAIDATPFREWLLSIRPEFITTAALATSLGIGVTVIEKVMAGTKTTVAFSTVDRALCGYGRPDLLESLYPMARVA